MRRYRSEGNQANKFANVYHRNLVFVYLRCQRNSTRRVTNNYHSFRKKFHFACQKSEKIQMHPLSSLESYNRYNTHHPTSLKFDNMTRK